MSKANEFVRRMKAWQWKRAGRVPHAYGYNAARWFALEGDVRNGDERYGWDGRGFDERAVEYPWIFRRMKALTKPGDQVLDAGSILNHSRVLAWWRAAMLPPVSIVTLAHEGRAEVSNGVRYEFADLRRLPYRDEWFSAVLCISTIEHVGMDNTGYGASVPASSNPGAEAVLALRELHRVTRAGGTLLLSVPFGTPANRGWFRVFDEPALDQLTGTPGWTVSRRQFFRAQRDGWRECTAAQAADAGYNDPNAGPEGHTAPAWVGGAEAVALVELRRES